MVVPSKDLVLLDVQATQGCHPGGYRMWLSPARTPGFNMSRPPRGVSNMVAESWTNDFLSVQKTTQGGI
eukprot:2946521-Pyramimonas_sp.AAC.1